MQEIELLPETVKLEVDSHDLWSFRHALGRGLKETIGELTILRKTKDRDLTVSERACLPVGLRQLSREDLQEQIDPWISLQDHLGFWLDRFEKGLKELDDIEKVNAERRKNNKKLREEKEKNVN